MANWFKMHETDLDNERLQWAMSEQQQVAIVYVALLSRCCHNQSDSIEWHGDDFELFALAQKVHITAPIANQCLQLLAKIGFIEITKTFIRCLLWRDKQDDYLARKESGYWKKRQRKPRVTVNHGETQCVTDIHSQRREEERIGDKSTVIKKTPVQLVAEIPIPESINTESFRLKWTTWTAFRMGMKRCRDWSALFGEQLEMLAKFPPDVATQMLSNSIQGGWTGLFEIRTYGANQRNTQPNPRNNNSNQGRAHLYANYSKAAPVVVPDAETPPA